MQIFAVGMGVPLIYASLWINTQTDDCEILREETKDCATLYLKIVWLCL